MSSAGLGYLKNHILFALGALGGKVYSQRGRIGKLTEFRYESD